MKRLVVSLTIMAMAIYAFAQTEEPAKNSWGGKLRESNFHLGVDFQTKYIWRGMEMITQDAAPVVFLAINYSIKGFNAYL